MRITKAMTQCYTSMYESVMDAAKDPTMSFDDLLIVGNRLCGMYDIIYAATFETPNRVPQEIEDMQCRYERELTRKMEE